ncbi:hypothetical protein [Stutzerimonas nitrititolerans]|uniref:Uncharacterized protein n=1 Tax=Stutzerimonas nitrititolerans TaxID=2482751 RepID=A0AA42BE80_9GAMM|nr:hypothetical protein [Stutzerimonas nitrititolerans]MCO7546131.1 hypothetical protein [Stutzerimonas nitrititolerans]
MSKVLVDRELLERVAELLAWDGMDDTTPLEFGAKCDGLCKELSDYIAQPAEAEGVEVVGVVCISHFKNNPAMENVEFHLAADLPQGQHEVILHSSHLAALSAVTAERDRLREAAELLSRLRGLINCTPENDIDKIPVWISTKHPTIERIDALRAAMAAKEV